MRSFLSPSLSRRLLPASNIACSPENDLLISYCELKSVRQLPVVASGVNFRYREVVEFCAG